MQIELEPIIEAFWKFWPHFLGLLHLSVAILASVHAIMHKRDPRSAVTWVLLIWLSPIVGATLYMILGINRLFRKADIYKLSAPTAPGALPINLRGQDGRQAYGERVTGAVLIPGNRITALSNGDEAYPKMLEAIREAKKSITLCTYIFNNDHTGRQFVDELSAAKLRGVEVRVLIDSLGSRYSFPTIFLILRKKKINAKAFLRSLKPWEMSYANLRNHRKILIVDGRIGFTGGLNISQYNLLSVEQDFKECDLHFQIEGPAVVQLQKIFASDWAFTSGELLKGSVFFPDLKAEGEIQARVVADGPGEDFETIRWILLGAITNARKNIRILTPYFLPDAPLTSALKVAATSGKEVEIILPEVNNLKFVQWACLACLPDFLKYGCKIYFSPPPFDHSKLVVIDDDWVILGSANWDARSLRLNYEANIECFNGSFGSKMQNCFEKKKLGARAISLREIEEIPYHLKLRNRMARLFSPYL